MDLANVFGTKQNNLLKKPKKEKEKDINAIYKYT
jgi:hypothetical protein